MERQISVKFEREHIEVKLPTGHVVKLDKCKEYLIKDFPHWDFQKNYYVRLIRSIKTKYGSVQETRYLHRLILRRNNQFEIDHINRDPLDNRQSNLRYATRSQNMANRTKWKCTGKYKSKFIGVRMVHNNPNSWQASIKIPKGKQKHLGCFKTQEDAAKARDLAALKIYGEFAVLNFPDKLSKDG